MSAILSALALGLALQGKLEGTVVAPGGAPVAGARVILGEFGRATLFFNTAEEMFVGTPGLSDADARRFSALLSTDATGRFSVEELEAGEYSILAAEPRAGIAFATFRVERGVTAALRLSLSAPASITGTVEGLAFDPSVDVLELKPRAALGNISMVPRLVLEQGSWSFRSAALPAVRAWQVVGTHVVLAQDYRATLFDLPVDAPSGVDTTFRFALDGGACLTGRVADANGTGVRDASVVAIAEREPSCELGALTDAEGRYQIRGLSDGKWRIEVLRFGMREAPGCGNGPQEIFGSSALAIEGRTPRTLDLRVETIRAAPRVGELAPDFTARSLDGETLALSAFRGKVVLLDFWATWCGMCRAEFPRLQAVHAELGASQRFEIIGVSVDEDAALVKRFVASRALRWPQTALGAGAKNPIAALYNVHSTPSTVLIGADGRVVAINLTGEPLRARIEALLAPK
ncbi:MAG TPA: redoxin domain-containing protein [Planctomycetota bacterium]|nr:redoxin domain-containing protein [Planctomycetota bacterium]